MSDPITVRTDTLIGQTDGKPVHPSNQADAAWAEIEELRAEAKRLNVPINLNWPLVILREQVAAARAR
jgi:hypothetical protein